MQSLEKKLFTLSSQLTKLEARVDKLKEERDTIVEPYNDYIQKVIDQEVIPLRAQVEATKKEIAESKNQPRILDKIKAILDGSSPGFAFASKVQPERYGACVLLLKESTLPSGLELEPYCYWAKIKTTIPYEEIGDRWVKDRKFTLYNRSELVTEEYNCEFLTEDLNHPEYHFTWRDAEVEDHDDNNYDYGHDEEYSEDKKYRSLVLKEDVTVVKLRG